MIMIKKYSLFCLLVATMYTGTVLPGELGWKKEVPLLIGYSLLTANACLISNSICNKKFETKDFTRSQIPAIITGVVPIATFYLFKKTRLNNLPRLLKLGLTFSTLPFIFFLCIEKKVNKETLSEIGTSAIVSAGSTYLASKLNLM